LSETRGSLFEPVQQLIYALELRPFVQEALSLERLRNFRNQTPPQTAEIGERSEYPYGRYSKRDDAEELYCMTGSAPSKEVTGLRLFGGINTFRSDHAFGKRQ
jgi:hypothetical protein